MEIARDKGEFISTGSHLRRRRRAPSSISCIEALSFLFSLRRAARSWRAQRESIYWKRFSVNFATKIARHGTSSSANVVISAVISYSLFSIILLLNRETDFSRVNLASAANELSRAIDIMAECVLSRWRDCAISDPFVRDGAGESKISISKRDEGMNRDANQLYIKVIRERDLKEETSEN